MPGQKAIIKIPCKQWPEAAFGDVTPFVFRNNERLSNSIISVPVGSLWEKDFRVLELLASLQSTPALSASSVTLREVVQHYLGFILQERTRRNK